MMVDPIDRPTSEDVPPFDYEPQEPQEYANGAGHGGNGSRGCPPVGDDAPCSPMRILSPAELWAPLPPMVYAVGGVLPHGSVGMMVATGSSLKTWAMLDLAIAKATGRKWLGRFDCEKGPVLVIDWESGDYELRRRLQRLSPTAVEGVEAMTMPALYLNSPSFEATLRDLAHRYSMVLFDSLAAGTVDLDENDARFAAPLYRIHAVASETMCSMFILHHSRKAKEGEDERDRPRGSSAIFAALDVCLQLSRAPEGAFLCRQTKARGGKAVDPFVLRVDDVDEQFTAVLASDPDKPDDVTAGAQGMTDTKARVVRLLAQEHDLRSANEIHRRIKGRKGTALEAVKELLERKTIAQVEGVFRLTSEASS